MYLKEFKRLNELIGYRVQLFYHSPTLPFASTYVYHDFNYEIREDDICIMDESHDDCRTFVNFNEIKEVKDLGEDLYHNVIDLVTEQFTISICCDENEPIPEKCDKCEKEFKELDQIWFIKQIGGYGANELDGELVNVKICNDCLSTFIKKDGEQYEQ